jgi:putative membrane protein
MNMIRLLLIGLCIGIANVIPGVSGGTIAVIFNIYNEFVDAITFNVKKLIKNWKFIVPLILGMLLGVLLFSKIVTILYSNFPIQTDFVFTGLIIGSIPLLYNYVRGDKSTKVPVKNVILNIIFILVGLAIIIGFTLLEKSIGASEISKVALPEITFKLLLIIFLAGILGAVAMIIPGISGSLIMLIMGVYPIIITCIPSLFNPELFVHALLLLLPNGIGVLIGLLCGAKLISFLFKKAQQYTYSVILGLLLGSIYSIFPGFSSITNVWMGIACVVCLMCGILIAYFGSKYESK